MNKCDYCYLSEQRNRESKLFFKDAAQTLWAVRVTTIISVVFQIGLLIITMWKD
jgi:hypothetical protein